MEMNFNLITKLAKLANNNPNENEANLAARKVCRLLAEGKFEFTNEPPLRGRSPIQPQSSYSWWKPTKEQEDYIKYDQYYDFINDFINDFFKSQPFSSRPDPPKTEYRYGSWVNEPTPKWPGDGFKKPSEQKEERLLKCRICKNSKLTKFVGLAELYECNTCQWTAYESKSKK